jgi:hypothetical protein
LTTRPGSGYFSQRLLLVTRAVRVKRSIYGLFHVDLE